MPEQCPKCHQETLHKNGRNKGRQAWRCRNPDCKYSRIDGAGIHGSAPKVKADALTQVEKNRRSRPVTGTARTRLYWYVVASDRTKEGFIALVRDKRSAVKAASPNYNVWLLTSYPAHMQRWLWGQRAEENNSEENENASERFAQQNGD